MTPTFLEATLPAAGLLMLCALWWRRWQTRWVRKLRLSGARGTVYVMQDRKQPHLVKVGVTTRPSRERQAEIVHTMAAGAPLRQLLALDLAHARSIETVAHRRLRRRRHHSERGREWYHAATPRQLAHILAEVEHAARDIKLLARSQGAWSQDDEKHAYRCALTRTGPSRTPLFRPGRMSPSPPPRLPGLPWRPLAAALLALPLLLAGGGTTRAAVDCPDAGLLGPGLLSSICWDCIFPIRLGGGVLAAGGGDIPERAADEPICLCPDALGVPHLGITWSMWEPARLIELVRAPGCSPVLGGVKIEATGELQRGSRGGMLYDKGDRAFYHYHLWAFPLLAMLELFTPADCQRDAGIDMDLLYFSELDPTWIHDELAFFANPESAAVANPAAQAACIADAVAATAGEPLDQLFWCAGSWGALYPLSGAHLTHSSMPRNTSLLATRSLAAMHRRGLARRTMGSDALCKAQIEPFLPKSQYQLSQAYPRPEANGRHAVGASTFAWGEHRVLPGVGEDFVHLVWRWLDCCLTY